MQKTEDVLDTTEFGQTERTDLWWVYPLVTAVGLIVFIVYSTLRSFHPIGIFGNGPTHHGPLLSPFFAPTLFGEGAHAWFGSFPSWWPRWFRSPAFLILWAPLGFRVTCYYYRKAYYRAFFFDPSACSVGEGHEDYRGEKNMLVFQNLHRYFLYIGLLFLVVLWYDAFKACFGWEDGFKITVGSLVLTANAFFLSGYTLSCHSLRYLVGGRLRCFSCPGKGKESMKTGRYGLWKAVTQLNLNHPVWAWISLYMVAFADFYVYMVATGNWMDVTLIS